jgi:hypothetical protein
MRMRVACSWPRWDAGPDRGPHERDRDAGASDRGGDCGPITALHAYASHYFVPQQKRISQPVVGVLSRRTFVATAALTLAVFIVLCFFFASQGDIEVGSVPSRRPAGPKSNDTVADHAHIRLQPECAVSPGGLPDGRVAALALRAS